MGRNTRGHVNAPTEEYLQCDHSRSTMMGKKPAGFYRVIRVLRPTGKAGGLRKGASGNFGAEREQMSPSSDPRCFHGPGTAQRKKTGKGLGTPPTAHNISRLAGWTTHSRRLSALPPYKDATVRQVVRLPPPRGEGRALHQRVRRQPRSDRRGHVALASEIGAISPARIMSSPLPARLR